MNLYVVCMNTLSLQASEHMPSLCRMLDRTLTLKQRTRYAIQKENSWKSHRRQAFDRIHHKWLKTIHIRNLFLSISSSWKEPSTCHAFFHKILTSLMLKDSLPDWLQKASLSALYLMRVSERLQMVHKQKKLCGLVTLLRVSSQQTYFTAHIHSDFLFYFLL